MKKFILSLAVLLTAAVYANAANTADVNSYTVNDQQIENVIANSVDATPANVELLGTMNLTNSSTNMAATTIAKGADKSAITAIILDWAVGYLGIHRLYLGTKTMTWVVVTS